MVVFLYLTSALMYSAGLGLVVAGGFLAWRTGDRRMGAHAAVLALIVLNLVQGLVFELFRHFPPVSADPAYPGFLNLLDEWTSAVLIAACGTALGRFLFLAAGQWDGRLPRILVWMVPWGSWLAAFVVLGRVELHFLLVSAGAAGFCLAVWRRMRTGPILQFRRGLVVLLAVALVLELLFMPELGLLGPVLSPYRYFIHNDVVYLVFLVTSCVYLRAEWAQFRKDRAAAAGQVKEPETLAAPDQISDLLSAREKEVAACLLQGMGNREIADALCISLSTVKTHLHNMLEKTGNNSRTALVVWLHGPGRIPGVPAGSDREA